LFPAEGAVLDLWMPDMSRLQSRQDSIAESVVCDKSLRPRFPTSGHQDSIAQGDFIRLGKLRGMTVTAADVFDSVEQETSLSNAKPMSKINCIATAFEYGRQAGPSRLESVTREGATAEIVCHADL
jgi:hypothetical protein